MEEINATTNVTVCQSQNIPQKKKVDATRPLYYKFSIPDQLMTTGVPMLKTSLPFPKAYATRNKRIKTVLIQYVSLKLGWRDRAVACSN